MRRPSLSQCLRRRSRTIMMVSPSRAGLQMLPHYSSVRPVISNPMDFQTMSKKLKARQYKSKKEFKDDLDLIWSNCCTYNSTEVCLSSVASCSHAQVFQHRDTIFPKLPYGSRPRQINSSFTSPTARNVQIPISHTIFLHPAPCIQRSMALMDVHILVLHPSLHRRPPNYLQSLSKHPL